MNKKYHSDDDRQVILDDDYFDIEEQIGNGGFIKTRKSKIAKPVIKKKFKPRQELSSNDIW